MASVGLNPAGVPVSTLLKRFEEAKTSKKKYDKTWARNRRLFKANSWFGIEKIAWFQSEPEYAKVFEYIEIMRGFLSDNKWGLDVIPASLPPDVRDAIDANNDEKKQEAFNKVASKMGTAPQSQDLQALLNEKVSRVNKMLDFLWVDTHMQSKLSAMLIHLFTTGTGIIKSTFDPDNVSDAGIGQLEVNVVDPNYFFPDPDASSMHDASFVIEKHPVSVRWVIERYPELAEEFNKATSQSSLDFYAPKGDQAGGTAPVDEGKRVDILECWYKDSAIVQEGEEGEVGSAKYPNGRYTLMSDKGFVLEDKANEYAGFPYTRFVEIPMPGEFWGDCTVDRVASLQLIINQLMRAIIDNGLWMVHGIWIVDDISGLTPKELAGYGPRDVVVKKVGSTATRDVGQPLPHTIFQTLQDTITAFDRVAGIPDVMRGIVPSRQPVATVQLQQESGEVRTRERSRRIEEGLEDLGRQWLGIVSKFWVDKRAIRSSRLSGGFDMFQLSKKDMEGWRFDLHVRPGSTTPMDTSAAYDRAKSMRQELQIPIPDEFFLRMAQIPGLEASVMAANQEAEAAAAQADQSAEPVTEEEFAGMDAPPDEQGDGDQFPDPFMEGQVPLDPEAQGLQLP